MPTSRGSHLRRRYGLELEQYDDMLEAQGGVCGICGTDDPGLGMGDDFHVDHCHDDGVVRGLLCFHCNTGLGKFADEPERLRRAADYIECGGSVQTLSLEALNLR